MTNVTKVDAEAIRQEFAAAYLARCVYASPSVSTDCNPPIEHRVHWKIKINDSRTTPRVVIHDEALRVATLVESEVASLVNPANDLGGASVTTPDEAHKELVGLLVALKEREVPAEGGYVVAPPWFCGLLLNHPDYTFADRSEAGLVIRTSGIDVYESTSCPSPSAGTHVITAGTPLAIECANTVSDRVRILRSEDSFADVVDGEVLYGARLIRPTGIVTRTVSGALA